jgi:trehalose 6-phosphate phosphatase
MKTLERQESYGLFLEQLSSAPARILLLDYDGTLSPFCPNRESAIPYRGVPPLIARIMRTGTRVVMISGRPAREVVLLSGLEPHPEVWGSHGLERLRPDGRYEVTHLPPPQQAGLDLAAQSLRAQGLHRHLEIKPGGVAVHWRGLGADAVESIKAQAERLCLPFLNEYSLNLRAFDGGLELRVPGADKGDAVCTILSESSRGAAVAYLGDDLTDEDAFRVLKGRGLTVLVRPQSRPTAADIWLQPPQELVYFLEEWIRASGGES